ncbi:YciI family protein [Nocardia brevicatena]|uniref:YciI family protein n=1 Tax=Nocardia brevicatena TaxID=37327 RepID=UPI0002F009A3
MARYLLGIYQPDTGEVPDDLDDIMRNLEALNDEMRAAGVWVFAAGLHPPASATVVHPGPDTLITDGPYIEVRSTSAASP